jgi:hypothetical protein
MLHDAPDHDENGVGFMIMRTLAVTVALLCGLLSAPSSVGAEVRITEPYVRMVMRDAYFWAWPLINIYNRRLAFEQIPSPGLLGGIMPGAPVNRLAMLSNYIAPEERIVACPNQDVVYGGSVVALEKSAVVVQVPDFGKRFWVYQVVDLRTDSFADIGAMYGTKPGFYLLAGPDWKGEVPAGIAAVFRAKTNTGFVVPRVFQEDPPQDNKAVQALIAGIDIYPLAEYDGKMKRRDWSKLPKLGDAASGDTEAKWVFPEKFLEQLPIVMKDAPPLPGEEARYAQIRAVLAAAEKNPALKEIIADEAARTEKEVISPLFEFRNFGIPLPHNWSTQVNGAQFGTDYLMRTAVAKSNILVNKANETKYFYQDLDSAGARLNGTNRYTVTFAKDALPPVRGFWSLTVYNQHHFFEANALKRYSLGTKNKGLKRNADGSMTLYVQAESPGRGKEANWLPAPANADFSLYVRAYWPDEAINNGTWTPPAVVRSP